jgi:hypothetical protein
MEVGPTMRLSNDGGRAEPSIVLELAQASASTAIDVFDVRGRRVSARDAGSLEAGTHVIALGTAMSLRPGLYFVRVRAGGFEQSLRFVHLGGP